VEPRLHHGDPAIDLSGGPFKITKVSAQSIVTLRANPKWWGTKPNSRRITVHIASTGPAGAVGALRLRAGGPAQHDHPGVPRRDDLASGRPEPDRLSGTLLQLEMASGPDSRCRPTCASPSPSPSTARPWTTGRRLGPLERAGGHEPHLRAGSVGLPHDARRRRPPPRPSAAPTTSTSTSTTAHRPGGAASISPPRRARTRPRPSWWRPVSSGPERALAQRLRRAAHPPPGGRRRRPLGRRRRRPNCSRSWRARGSPSRSTRRQRGGGRRAAGRWLRPTWPSCPAPASPS
jgi:hypothetical protein